MVIFVIHSKTNFSPLFFRSVESEGLDIVNVRLSAEAAESTNFDVFDSFCGRVQQVEKSKGVALVLSDETGAGGDCRDGSGAALCIAYLIRVKKMSLETALAALKAKRPQLKPSSSLTLSLHEYEQHCRKKGGGRMGVWRERVQEGSYKLLHSWLPVTIYVLILLTFVRFVTEVFVEPVSDKNDPELPCL